MSSVKFSGDGQCVLASTKNGFVRLMDKANGQLLAEYAYFVLLPSYVDF